MTMRKPWISSAVQAPIYALPVLTFLSSLTLAVVAELGSPAPTIRAPPTTPPATPEPTRTPYTTHNTSAPSDPAPPSSPQQNLVTGWNIFWVIFTLSISCLTHPIGSSCGLPPLYRRSIRANPLISISDTLHLITTILHRPPRCTLRSSIHRTITHRLETNTGTPTPDTWSNDLRLRALIVVPCILQYLKLCGYHGIPIQFTIATVLFAAWFIMEALFFAASLDARYSRRPHSLPGAQRIRRRQLSRRIGLSLVFVQTAAVIVAAAILRPPPAPPPTEPGLTWLETYFRYALGVPLGLEVEVSGGWIGIMASFFDRFPSGALGIILVIVVWPLWWFVMMVPVFTINMVAMGAMVCAVAVPIVGGVVLVGAVYQGLKKWRVVWRVVRGCGGRYPVGVARVAAVVWWVAVGVYYGWVYDGNGTGKELWVEGFP